MVDLAVPRSEGGVEVVHAVAGRVRLRASENSSRDILENLAKQLQQLRGVRQICTNETTGSLLIRFDTSNLSLSQLFEAIQRQGISVGGESSSGVSEQLIPSEAFSQVYGKLHSLLPLFVGILTTRQLGIQGWQSLPVYLMTTSLTRQVIKQFDPGLSLEATSDISQENAARTNSILVATEAVTDNLVKSVKIAYSLVHAIPGRLRFQIPLIAQDRDYAQRLQKLITADARVTNCRCKPAAESVVIIYKAESASTAVISAHLITLIQAAAARNVSESTKAPAAEEVCLSTVKEVITKTEKPKAALPKPTADYPEDQDPPNNSSGEEQPPLPENSEVDPDHIASPEVEVTSSKQTTLDNARQAITSSEEKMELSKVKIPNQTNPWSCFKPAALCAMLRFLANQPLRRSASL
ncbi:HMA2 domain-containing protein [Lyngbya aestuarii]|uniref:HMA2 domain-containing protein n=1 Tax=Lyngbya aestuarii TaxID=118322 RepID=UPI00403DE478